MNRPGPTGRVSIAAIVAGAAGLCVAAGAASAQNLEVIYTKIPTHPTSIIPGALDLSGQPVETRWRSLETIIVSPDGSRWFLSGRTQLGSDLEVIALMGSGTEGTMWLQEGQPVPGGEPGELIDFLGSGLGRFDDNNRFALSLRARGGASATAQKVVFWDGENFSIPFTQGTLLQELVDHPNNVTGDERFGNSVGSIHLLNDGRIGSQDSTIQNCHSSYRPAIFYDTVAFHQSNVTSVAGLNGIGLETWSSINGNSFYTTPDGAHWWAKGRVLGQAISDMVLVYDGQVRFQTGFPIEPGSPRMVRDVVQTEMASSGRWYARGTDTDGGVWAAVDGQIYAKTGDPINPGSSQTWGTTFLAFNGNSHGDWVLVGTTSNPDFTQDTVVVLNGERVIAREGQPVDIDGNGLFDDDAYIGRGNPDLSAFEPNDAVLTDNLDLYLILNLHNEAGEDLNSSPAFTSPQCLVRVRLGGGGPTCPADWDGNGSVNSNDISAFLGAWLESVQQGTLDADFDQSGSVNSNDISAFLSAWLDAVGGGC